MGDTEPMFAQTSTTMDYSNSGYNPVGYGDGSSAASATQGTTEVGEFSVSTTATESAAINQTTTGQDSYATPAYDAKGTFGLTTSDQDMVSLQSVAMDSSGAGGYASYQNGSAACDVSHAVSSENGNVSHNVGVGADVQLLEDGSVSAVSAMSAEEERLWSIVSANSLDFDAWVALIEETEKVAEGNILKLRRVYDSFLAEFPLCYGYWKKYADHEALGSTDKAVEVYERAVQAVTYSVDIWLHYCRFAISKYEEPDIIRRLFERGLEYVGTDYLSYTLWDEYIEYEYKHQEWSHIAGIYTRVFESPILYLDKYYNSFKELAASRPVSELRTAEEASAAAAAANSVSESTTHVNEGDVGSDAVEQSTKPVSAGSTEAEELEKYIAIRDEMYRKAKEFDSKIVGFETAIGRPYFHVKPLNVAELENWHNYLNFMEREDDFSKVVKLYERCLVACANYPEFWIRYVKCMETRGSMDLAENALVRATQVFVKSQPEIHLFAAWFKEHNGDTAGARAAYQLVHAEISPGLLEAIIKHANMERRLGNIDDGLSVYEQAIAIEKGKEHSQALPILFAQYARFLYLAPGKLEKARDLLVEAPEHVQLSKPFLEALMCLETVIPMPKRIEYIDMLVEKFIVPNSDNPNVSSISEREELSCIYLEFLDLLGDASAIKKAHDRHLKLFFNNRSSSLSRKRQADDLSSEKSKLPKSDPSGGSAVQSLMGAYPSAAAQNQWNTAYGIQPQAWPQAAQAPVQQWNPGYPQQSAAYGAYGAAYPQATAPAAQTAAYGAYPATYPAQTYSQQSYAQPTTAAAAPTSQTTSVPQAYYGSYY